MHFDMTYFDMCVCVCVIWCDIYDIVPPYM